MSINMCLKSPVLQQNAQFYWEYGATMEFYDQNAFARNLEMSNLIAESQSKCPSLGAPEIGVPPNHQLFVGFSLTKTNHFG